VDRKIKILLIEDNPGDARLIEEMLKEANVRFELVCEERLSSGIERIRSDGFDIILLDLGLPDSQGLGTLTKLNEIRQVAPVIVLTGLADETVGLQAVQEGAQDFLVKGQIEKNLLMRSIKYAIERKKTGEALKATAAELKEAQRVAHIGSWDWDAVTDTITWSAEYYSILNLDPKVPPPDYQNHLKIYTPESSARLDAAVKKATQTGEPYELDLEIAEPTGPTRWICARSETKRDTNGRIVGLRGTAQDITERKKAEDKLRESEEQFRSIFNSAMDGILIADIETYKFLTGNNTICRMLGYTVDEIGGLSVMDIHSEKDMPYVIGQFEKLVRREIVIDIDVPVRRKDGSIFYADITTSALTFAGKACLMGIFRDITERKKAEKELWERDAFIRNILETVDEGFIIVDRQYRILSANKAFCRSANLQEGQVLGRLCYEVAHHCDKPCFECGEECAVKHTFETGEPHEVSHTHVSDNGTKYHVEIKSYPITDASGNVVSAIETINDVTEQKKLEEQLRHAQKMEAVGTLAGGIAHDFNNILNVIMGYGAMVLDSLESDSPSKDQMNEVLAAAERAANLTKRLLVFSRQQVVDVKPIDVNETILGVQKMLVRIIRENIEFNLDLADSQLKVMADAGQIEQVLMNLTSNARDAMPEGGRLTISTRLQELDDEYVATYGYGEPGMYTLITVADTGCGMDAETQNKIFEPFFTTKGIGEGTGLGLAISYGIIKQHNGYIKVYSEPGQGTVFKIYLPVVEESGLPDKMTEAPDAVKGGNETVLVAEDDASLRKLTRIVLESYGYSVITAEDGEDAITKFMENTDKIQLAILDMIMPKKSGKEASEVIRGKSPLTKILFASGYTMDNINTRELTESGFDFIIKPIRPQDLLRKVREMLDRKA
jgi:PAS domain S-box-containing protein